MKNVIVTTFLAVSPSPNVGQLKCMQISPFTGFCSLTVAPPAAADGGFHVLHFVCESGTFLDVDIEGPRKTIRIDSVLSALSLTLNTWIMLLPIYISAIYYGYKNQQVQHLLPAGGASVKTAFLERSSRRYMVVLTLLSSPVGGAERWS